MSPSTRMVEASRSDQQSKPRPSRSSTSVSTDSTHASTPRQLQACLDESLAKHLYGESRILQCIASSGYASSTSSSSSSLSIASEAFAARVGLYAIAHPGSASPRELVVRVMNWAEDVEQHAPMLERKGLVWETTPLVPPPSRNHIAKYGTGENEARWVFCRNSVATYWDSVGDRKIHLYFREDEVLGEAGLENNNKLGRLTWWQCSMIAVLFFAAIAVGSWVMLSGRAQEDG